MSIESEHDIHNSESDVTSVETVNNAVPAESPAAHINYVLAERNKRMRAFWGQTPAANAARAYLIDSCGIVRETMEQYHIGLISSRSQNLGEQGNEVICIPIPDKKGPQFAPCLAADHPDAKRRGQYVHLGIPGIIRQGGDLQWKRGAILTMYITPEKGCELIVCARVAEAICLAQFLNEHCADRFGVMQSQGGDRHHGSIFKPKLRSRGAQL